MNKIMYVLSVISILFPGSVMAGLFGGPSNYDECMVERMKGQERYMYSTVKKSCEREFEVKVEKKYLVDLDWTDTTSSGVIVSIGKNDSEFEVTRAALIFSKKSCEESKDTDFNVQGEANFSSWIPGKSSATKTEVKLDNSYSVKCFRTVEVYGRRIK